MRMGTNSWRIRSLSAVLAFVMILGLLPDRALAKDPEYSFGTMKICSTSADGQQQLVDSYYFSEDWFWGDSFNKNNDLALVSMQLTAAAAEEKASGAGGTFLKSLGFESVGFAGNMSSDSESCNYLYGTKEIKDGSNTCTLAVVVMQSYTLDSSIKKKGWVQNFTVNNPAGSSGKEHYAFSKAVDKVIGHIAGLKTDDNTRYWIMGQSRGGALANILSAKLPDKTGISRKNIFAYTFESPATVDGSVFSSSSENISKYGYIHNYRCTDDIITYLPPWEMTRYGEEYRMQGGESDQALKKQLERLGSIAANESYEIPDNLMPEKLAGSLMIRVPNRASYTSLQKDLVKDASGKETTISYTYQAVLCKLVELMLGGEMEGLPLSSLMNDLDGLSLLIQGEVNNNKNLFWQGTQKMYSLLKSAAKDNGKDLPFTDKEMYAILHLFAPLLIDMDFAAANPVNEETLSSFLLPVVLLAGSSKSLIFSHHFDTIVARLKLLAPAPAMGDAAFDIDTPSAGDNIGKAPADVESAVNALGNPWLTATAKWDTKDTSLKDNRSYYLDVTLKAVGHTVPEDLLVTINGQKPVKALKMSCKNGVDSIRGTWLYTIGAPEEVTVSFDIKGHGQKQDPVKMKVGSKLAHELTPVDFGIIAESDGKWQFTGWKDKNGISWEEITVEKDMTLYADWVRLIDTVQITLALPCVGETPQFAFNKKLPYAVPDGALYTVQAESLVDDNYNDVTSVQEAVEHSLNIIVKPVSEKYRFWTEKDEFGFSKYMGTASFNGEIVPDYQFGYHDDEGTLSVTCTFTPEQAKPDEKETEKPQPESKEEPSTEMTPDTEVPDTKETNSVEPNSEGAGTDNPETTEPDSDEPANLQLGEDGTALGRGASADVAEKAILAMTSDRDPAGSVFNKLRLKSTKQTKKSVRITWKKVPGARKYVIYGNRCGKKYKMKKLAAATRTSKTFKKIAGKKVKKGTYYKFIVVAIDKEGKVISTSRVAHAATKGGKVGNTKKVTTAARKNKVTLKAGKTFKLKAKAKAVSKKKKVKKHRSLVYESSNPAVATVSRKGVIKAGKTKGTCRIFVYAQNGVYKNIKVTVK